MTLLLCVAALSILVVGLVIGFVIDDCNGNPGVILLADAAGLAVVWLAVRLLVRRARHVGNKRPPLLAMVIVGLTVFLLLWVLGAILFVETDCST